ncbi:hypothetical protein DYD21_10175 [Rhodohalobacter sp. SW132]|uniref:endonuclease/exonuclease/phosphatase family protein n=1 Tax=Rhodohalobacter sp. SW132 TaxID=2293433 RepID=UPI000E2681EF|nr:endonuclease/exonuclease/phosphatase family protein [Rhodohalobacter sp. SW132]REL33763.1 hypothetical protein DYD21_10175 [Rhodohalobacter sp. SW132]
MKILNLTLLLLLIGGSTELKDEDWLSCGLIFNESISVMSYNIRFDNPDDGKNAWPHRSDHVAEMMGPKYESDIIGVQEALRHQLDELQEMLPNYDWVGVGRDDGKDAGEFSPIFYKKNRFELIATNTFWLSEETEMPGSISWDSAITRIVTWVKFNDLLNDKIFYVFNTHFDHRGDMARVESTKIILERASKIEENTPVIITGDLNFSESSSAYGIFRENSRFNDARYASETGHEGPTASSNNWEELRLPESRIDYIFVSEGVRVLNHRILDDRYDGRFPSDHLPVISEIILP